VRPMSPDEPPIAACIAVVDDDSSVRKALRRLLTAAGYAVETYSGAAEYVARRSTARVECLVLDVRMPAVTGLDLQRHLVDVPGAPPIVMITGHGNPAVRERALATGAVAVLDKPFSDEMLLAAITRARARRPGAVVIAASSAGEGIPDPAEAGSRDLDDVMRKTPPKR